VTLVEQRGAPPLQQLGPFEGGRLSPGGERFGGDTGGAFSLAGAAVGHAGDDLAAGWAAHFEGLLRGHAQRYRKAAVKPRLSCAAASRRSVLPDPDDLAPGMVVG